MILLVLWILCFFFYSAFSFKPNNFSVKYSKSLICHLWKAFESLSFHILFKERFLVGRIMLSHTVRFTLLNTSGQYYPQCISADSSVMVFDNVFFFISELSFSLRTFCTHIWLHKQTRRFIVRSTYEKKYMHVLAQFLKYLFIKCDLFIFLMEKNQSRWFCAMACL